MVKWHWMRYQTVIKALDEISNGKMALDEISNGKTALDEISTGKM